MTGRILTLLLAVAALAGSPVPLRGGDCASCHQARGVTERAPEIKPIPLRSGGAVRTVSLEDVFRYHSHSCPGATTTFKALQYGLELLFQGDIPDVEDLAVLSRTPVEGVRDTLDYILTGGDEIRETPAPEGMKAGRDKFFYTLLRKSTGTAVDVQLKPEHYPENFYPYKKKQAEGALSPEEWEVLHGYMKDIILKFPAMPFEELFGRPEPYRFLFWGDLSRQYNRAGAAGPGPASD